VIEVLNSRSPAGLSRVSSTGGRTSSRGSRRESVSAVFETKKKVSLERRWRDRRRGTNSIGLRLEIERKRRSQ